jgi:hypothetical protein
MQPFKALYYPSDECHPLTLAKSILVFDEVTFYDHTSITVGNMGTVGHHSHMRGFIEPFKREGYTLNVMEPIGGPIENELQTLINVDIQNENFRRAFFKLVQKDTSFLVSKVPNGNYGKYGTADEYRKAILSVEEKDYPSSVEEIATLKPTEDAISPIMNLGLMMIHDSFNMNFSGYTAIDEDLHLFGDSTGMDTLLKTKFTIPGNFQRADRGVTQAVAFSLLDHVIPPSAFMGKKFTDIIHYRNEMHEERDRFKERILQMTVDLQNLAGSSKQQKIQEVLYRSLLPELRSYQRLSSRAWDHLFQESLRAISDDAEKIANDIVTVLPLGIPQAILAAAAHVGKDVLPHLVDFAITKKQLARENPYSYLMRF